jgi:hypothetical protein
MGWRTKAEMGWLETEIGWWTEAEIGWWMKDYEYSNDHQTNYLSTER